MIRRRTWRLRLAREWLAGWTFDELARCHGLSRSVVEAAIRRVVRVKAE